jgi:hypothetical protein
MRMTIKIMSAYGRPFDGPSAAFDEGGGTIGRRADCTLVVPDKRRHVSRIHALIVRAPDGFLLHDQGSYLPVRVNGMRVGYGQHVPICEGDTIQIGPFGMRVEEMETAWDLGLRAPADQPVSRRRDDTPVRREDVAQSFVITDLGVEGATPVDFVLDDGATPRATGDALSGGEGTDGTSEGPESRSMNVDTSTFDLLAQRLGAGSDSYQPFMPAVWEDEAGGLRAVPPLPSSSVPSPEALTLGHAERSAPTGGGEPAHEWGIEGPAPAERIRHLLAAVEADINLVRLAAEETSAGEEYGLDSSTQSTVPSAGSAEPAYPPGEPPLLMPEPRHPVPAPDRADVTEMEELDSVLRRRRVREDVPLLLQPVLTPRGLPVGAASAGGASDLPEIVLVLERVEADPGGSGAGEFLVPIRRRNRRSGARSSARR